MLKRTLPILLLAVMALIAIPEPGNCARLQPKVKSMVQKSQEKTTPARPKTMPDLIVSDIRLIKDCKIQITIKNIGTAGVPASGYVLSKGAGIQMYKGGKPWGGVRLGVIDPSRRLTTPGSVVKHIWFPRANNLKLGPGWHSLTVTVDNNNAVKELNEKNNSKTVRQSCQKPGTPKGKAKPKATGSRPSAGAAQKSPLQARAQRLPGSGAPSAHVQGQGTKLRSGAQYLIVSPDLVLTNFTVNQGAAQQVNNAFEFPFSVRIKNIGTGDVKNAFDLSFQTYSTAHQWSGENQPGFNCKRVNRLIKKGETTTYSGTLRILNYNISQDLRVRAYVDSACSDEFPDQWGQVGESNENNNHSNEVVLAGDYHPHIGSITPNIAIRGAGEVLMIGGTGFGSSQGSRTVRLRNGAFKIAANVTAWHNGVIYFTVPAGAKIGLNKVSIADAATLAKYPTANEVDLHVHAKKVLAWSDLISTWDLFKNAFSLTLNTHGGGSSYNNTSQITLLQATPVSVPDINFKHAGLRYRFLVKDMNSVPGGIILTRQGCNSNQLKMEVSFESSGVELKAFNRALLPGAKWCDNCVADIHINNGKMTVIFDFSATNGNMDFGLSTNFSASVSASNNFADALMNLFLGNWNQDVRNQINNGVKNGLSSLSNKSYILSEFDNLIRMLLGIGGKTITNIDFQGSGIHVTYTN
jgi:hypothetical protein